MNQERVMMAAFYYSRLADAIDLDDGTEESSVEIRKWYREWIHMSDLMPDLTGAEMSAGVEMAGRNSYLTWARIQELRL